MHAIEIVDLRVDYGDFTAVSNLSIAIGRGEVFGLVGPNGAGKTSTLNVLATLLEPTYGYVTIDGVDIEVAPQQARERIGYMPDLAPVIGNLRVWEFLDLFAHCYGFDGKERRIRVDECLDQVKLQDKRNVLCKTLSRGMTQRVVLAKTLLHRPKVLLLDEPASGMDPLARIDLKDTLERISSTGATIILSSHILTELAEMVSSVGILHHGTLRCSGSVDEVLGSLEQPSVEITAEFVGDTTPCTAWLAERGIEATADTRRSGATCLRFEITGGDEAQAELLAAMVNAGHRVRSFSARRSSLEDIMRSISAQ